MVFWDFIPLSTALTIGGQVVGMMVAPGDQFVHAFLWDGGKALRSRDLGRQLVPSREGSTTQERLRDLRRCRGIRSTTGFFGETAS